MPSFECIGGLALLVLGALILGVGASRSGRFAVAAACAVGGNAALEDNGVSVRRPVLLGDRRKPRDHTARGIMPGHVFMQTVRRGHYELGIESDPRRRVAAELTQRGASVLYL